MSKLNVKNTVASAATEVSQNGNLQFAKGAEQELYEIVVSTMYGNNSFYETTDDLVVRMQAAIRKVVASGNCNFIANTIIHARTDMNVRTMPIVMTVLYAHELRRAGLRDTNLRRVVRDVIQRADQITDMYAYALSVFGSKKLVPAAIKNGVADAFNKFNEYNFAKYSSDATVKMRDVIQIVHPKPKHAEQGMIFDKIIKKTLEVPYTWEVELSKNGQLGAEQKSKKDLWTELLSSGKVGFMAMLRNLRNIEEAGVDKSVLKAHVYSQLEDAEIVSKSKQFPFSFINAYEAISNSDTRLMSAISTAVDLSLGNLPKLGDNVWIILDCSGSMGAFPGQYGRGSTNSPIKTGSMFAAALLKANAKADNVKLTLFSDAAETFGVNTNDSVIGITQTIMGKVYGGGTNLQAALDHKSKLGFEPDTVVVISDMEVNSLRSPREATKIFKGDTVKIALNLNGGKSTPIGDRDGWYQLAGWSEKLFSFIPAMREKQSIAKTLSVPYMGVTSKAYKAE